MYHTNYVMLWKVDNHVQLPGEGEGGQGADNQGTKSGVTKSSYIAKIIGLFRS